MDVSKNVTYREAIEKAQKACVSEKSENLTGPSQTENPTRLEKRKEKEKLNMNMSQVPRISISHQPHNTSTAGIFAYNIFGP